MEKAADGRQFYSLYELTSLIKSVLSAALPDTCWITAEIAECKCNQKGHCYLDLVDRTDDGIVAQLKANIWAFEYRKISSKFEKATGESLRRGIKILLLASVNFHEVYGLSLSVKDIDPIYTLGEMALRKKEVIERLRKEGVIEQNKRLPLPVVPQRIAVVSSPNAAGYGDFFDQLDRNPFGYKSCHVLFPAVMQGQEAEDSMIRALNEIQKKKHLFDIVAIIRGGGSAVDLHCFDSYPLSRAVAVFPMPVVTGIGHEKDDTVVDIVAHTKMKTPTAVAEFIISGFRSFEESIMDMQKKIRDFTEKYLRDEGGRLDTFIRELSHAPLRIAAENQHRIALLSHDLISRTGHFFSVQDNRLMVIETVIRHLDPESVLRRGYSITRHKGEVLKSPLHLRKWAVIETTFHRGSVTSIVQDKKEEGKSGERQTDNLLPGFE